MMRRGDTLVEVMLATVILSIVLAGAFSLSNHAIQTGQGALERTEAVNLVREYAETLRFMHSSQTEGYQEAWDELLIGASSDRPKYDDDNYCNVSDGVTSPKFLDFDALGADPVVPANLVNEFRFEDPGGGRLDYDGTTDNNSEDLFAVWLEVYDHDLDSEGIVDIHIRACWDALASDNVERAGAVVRLSEVRDL